MYDFSLTIMTSKTQCLLLTKTSREKHHKMVTFIVAFSTDHYSTKATARITEFSKHISDKISKYIFKQVRKFWKAEFNQIVTMHCNLNAEPKFFWQMLKLFIAECPFA